MLAELIELCLEPKRINDLQHLESLFPDFLDNSTSYVQSQSIFVENNAQPNLENNNQQLQPPQIPLPPVPDIYIQQLNLNNDNYQLAPGHQCHYHQQDVNGSSNNSQAAASHVSSSHNRNVSCSNSNASSTNSTSSNTSPLAQPQNNQSNGVYCNQQNLYKQVFNKRNSLSPSTYSSNYCNLRNNAPFKNYCIQSPTSPNDTFCESCTFNLVNSSLSANHLTSIISQNLNNDVNWQSNLNTVRERNAVLFNNEYMSDITFLVGSSSNQMKDEKNSENKVQINKLPSKACGFARVPAHKQILAAGSTVFYAMLYGGLAEKSDIELPDVQPCGFLTLLRYLYCDDICLDADNVLPTFYCSKKYIVPYLSKACITYLKQTLSAENACILFSQIRMFEEEQDLIDQCLEVIDCQAELAFKSPSFVETDEESLKFILSRQTLNIKELFVYEALVRWSENACVNQNLDATAAVNKRKVLDRLIYLGRFPTMTLAEFANGPAQDRILTADETNTLFLHFTAKSHPNYFSIDKFNSNKRKGLEIYVCRRFKASKFHQSQWRYRDQKCDSIQFSVDRKVFLIGLGLFGSVSQCAVYKLKMELKRNNKILANKTTQLVSDGTSRSFRLMFDYPIEIFQNQLYTASVVLDGNSLSFYGQEGLTEVIWNKENAYVTFDFQCSSDSNNGTGVTGGQIPELLFYLPSLDNELASNSSSSILETDEQQSSDAQK